MFITVSYKELNTVVQTCWQVPCHPAPSNAVSSEPWATQETVLIQQALNSQLSSELAVHQFQRDFALAFSAVIFYPTTPHQLLLPQDYLIYGTLQIVLSCHFHNVSPVSDNALIKQFFVKPMYFKKSHDMEETARRHGEEETACGAVHMPRLWSSQSLTDLELWQWFIGGAGKWWERRAAMGYLIKLKLSWFSHRPLSVASISSHPYG